MKKLLLGLSGLFLLAAAGCGTSNRESGTNTAAFNRSSACIECHANSLIDPVTGVAVVTEWERGAHNTKNGAGCPDCHATNGHPSSGVLPTIPNSAICVTCHTAATMKTYSSHFSATSASFLGTSNVQLALLNPVFTGHANACLGCHNPHDNSTLLPVNRAWRSSGHGSVKDDTFNEEPFIKYAGGVCSRCHTGTGFRYYMTTGNQTVITTAILGPYSSAKEVIGCATCHTDYSFKRLSSDPNVAFRTYSTPYPRFSTITKRVPGTVNPSPDIGDSKLCIPCHAGRTGNRSGAAISTNRTSAPFDPHYFPSAAVMYAKIGFINFSTPTALAGAYGNSMIATEDGGTLSSRHRSLGTTATSVGIPNQDGPCVTCHMGPGSGHTWNITGATFDNLCVKCHAEEAGVPLNGSNFETAFLNFQRQQEIDALNLALELLERRYGITANLTDDERIENPQEVSYVFFPIANPPIPVTNVTGGPQYWTDYVTTGPLASFSNRDVYRFKGALYNIILQWKEPASYIHGRTYTRRLIYDAIDFLDDRSMNQSVSATAIALSNQPGNRVSGRYSKGAAAYTGNVETSPLAPGTSISMTYLNGYNRTTGAWNANERP